MITTKLNQNSPQWSNVNLPNIHSLTLVQVWPGIVLEALSLMKEPTHWHRHWLTCWYRPENSLEEFVWIILDSNMQEDQSCKIKDYYMIDHWRFDILKYVLFDYTIVFNRNIPPSNLCVDDQRDYLMSVCKNNRSTIIEQTDFYRMKSTVDGLINDNTQGDDSKYSRKQNTNNRLHHHRHPAKNKQHLNDDEDDEHPSLPSPPSLKSHKKLKKDAQSFVDDDESSTKSHVCMPTKRRHKALFDLDSDHILSKSIRKSRTSDEFEHHEMHHDDQSDDHDDEVDHAHRLHQKRRKNNPKKDIDRAEMDHEDDDLLSSIDDESEKSFDDPDSDYDLESLHSDDSSHLGVSEDEFEPDELEEEDDDE